MIKKRKIAMWEIPLPHQAKKISTWSRKELRMNFNFSSSEIQEQALAFMEESDLAPRDERDRYLKLDGQLHRYAVEGDKSGETSGAYVIHSDGFPAGYFQNWRTGVKLNWRFNATSLTQEQRDYLNSPEYKQAEEAKRKKREAEEKKRKAEASEQARIHYESYLDGDFSHHYLIKKDVKRHKGVRLDVAERRLVIPLRDIDGRLVSLQWINEDGSKRFFYGAPLEGTFYGIRLDKFSAGDNKSNVILLAEGYATAAQVHQLTGLPVIAAMTCGNLESVAKAIKGKFSSARIIVMADNDKKTELEKRINPGLDKARELVKKGLAVGVAAPEFENATDGTDWDDYALKYGIEKATQVITDLISEQSLTKLERKELKDFEQATVNYALNGFMERVIKNRERQGIKTGFEGFDRLLDGGFYPGLYVIGANSSMGKTTFFLQIADNIAKSGHEVLIISLEMARDELIAKTLSRISLVKSLEKYKSTCYAKTTRDVLLGRFNNDIEKKIIGQAIQEYHEAGQKIRIIEGVGNVKVSRIREEVERYRKQGKEPPVVIIDYLQILAPFDLKMTDKQNVDKNITELKRLSRDFEIPVLGISSFNRENYNAPVSMTSFKESGAIEYSSDVLIGMQYNGWDYLEGEKEKDGGRLQRLRGIRDAMDEAAKNRGTQGIQVKILKQRNFSRRSILFEFSPAFNYFREIPKE